MSRSVNLTALKEMPSISFKTMGGFRAHLTTILFVAAAAAIVHLSGLLSTFDQWDWDLAMRFQTSRQPSSKVVIVSIDDAGVPLDERSFERMASALASARPSAVVYTFHIPQSAKETLRNSAVPSVFPTASLIVAQNAENPSSLSLDILQEAVAAAGPASDGIYRRQRLVFMTDKGPKASLPLAALAAAKKSGAAATVERGVLKSGNLSIPVNSSFEAEILFTGSSRGYPYIPATKIMNGEIPPSALEGRILFVGPTGAAASPMLATPTTPKGMPMPETEFWAEVAVTLLESRTLNTISPIKAAIAIFLVTALSGILFARVSPPIGFSLLILFSVLSWGLVYIVFDRTNLQLPFTAMRIGIAASLVVVTIARVGALYSLLRQMLFRLKLRHRGALSITASTVQENWWEQAADSMSYYLDVQSQIFFEKPINKKHLRIACLRGISEQEISERRRDAARGPYSTAIKSGNHLLSDTFLEGNKQALLIPLAFGRQLLGFWVVSRDGDPQYYKRQSDLISLLATELAVSILRNQRISQLKKSRILERLQFEQLSSELSILEGLTEELLFERELLSSVLDSESNGTAACDPLGRLLIYNVSFVQILTRLKIPIKTDNFFETVRHLSRIDENTLKERIFRVVFQDEEASLNAVFPQDPESSYRLTIKAIRNQGEPGTNSIRGLVFHLMNITEMQETEKMKTHLADNFVSITKNLITPILGYSQLLEENEELSELGRGMVYVISDRAKKLSDLLEQSLLITESQESSEEFERSPVNMITLLGPLHKEFKQRAKDREIEVEFEHPEVISSIVCIPSEIQFAIESITDYFLENTPPTSAILIKLTERESQISLIVSSKNLGLPEGILERLVERREGKAGEGLSAARKAFAADGGDCRFVSTLKGGTAIEAVLPKALG